MARSAACTLGIGGGVCSGGGRAGMIALSDEHHNTGGGKARPRASAWYSIAQRGRHAVRVTQLLSLWAVTLARKATLTGLQPWHLHLHCSDSSYPDVGTATRRNLCDTRRAASSVARLCHDSEQEDDRGKSAPSSGGKGTACAAAAASAAAVLACAARFASGPSAG